MILYTNKTPQAVLAIGMLFVCCWPVSWTTSDPSINQNLWFQIATILGFSSVLIFGAKTAKPSVFVGLFLLIVLISHFFSRYDPPSLGLVLNKKFIFSPGTLNFLTIFCGAVWFFMISSVFDRGSLNILYDAICLIALTNLAFIAMQSFGYDPVQKSIDTIKITGLALNENLCSGLLAFCFPAFLRKKWIFLTPLVVIGLWLVGSRGGVLALGAGLFCLSVMSGKYNLAAVCVAGAIGAMTMIRSTPFISDSVYERFQMWEIGWQKFKEFWGLGLGPGQWQTALHELYFKKGQTLSWHNTAHNEFVQCTVEYGFLFIIWLGCYLGHIAWRIKQEAKISAMAFVIILANGLVSFPFRLACTGIIAVTWLAILEIELRKG